MREGPVLSAADRRLLDAARKGDVAGVNSALSEGADPRAKDERGQTAMCHAMEGTHADQPWPKFPLVVEALQKVL